MKVPWWQEGVLYQIYLRSFADSDGDGLGDLQGVLAHLDHLEWLGVDGIWLSPVGPSPDADFGYDVAKYCDVDRRYGTLGVLDRLVDEAGRRGIRVVLDLVPNHTSDHHPWFRESRTSRDAPRRDWYVWRDPKPDGSPPNNWLSSFGGQAWTFDQPTGQWYLHNFLPEQPDLNWWHPGVRQAFDEILGFWLDRRIAGFRIDVTHMIVKDAELRDNPPAGPEDGLTERLFGQRWEYNTNRPEVHEVLRRWHRIADAAGPERLLLGETLVDDLAVMASYYGTGDELHLALNFPFLSAPFEAQKLSEIVSRTESLLPPGAWPLWVGSNHDVSRMATRWANDDPRAVRCAQLVLLTLRGTPVLYQGDEIGLPDGRLPREAIKDPVGLRFWPAYAGRDPERTPMPWAPGPGAGFTTADTEPWLPLAIPAGGSVAEQREDPASVLSFCRELVHLRRRLPELRRASYEPLTAPTGTWCWRRGETVVAVNLTHDDRVVSGVRGEIVLGTEVGRRGEPVRDSLHLGPWEGAVIHS